MAILETSVWKRKHLHRQLASCAGGSVDVVEPASGKVLTRVGLANADDVAIATKLAAEAQPAWAATPVRDRAEILLRAAAYLQKNAEELSSFIAARPVALGSKEGTR